MTQEKKQWYAVGAGALAVLLGLLAYFVDFSAPKLTVTDSFEKECGAEISVYDLVERVEDKNDVTLTLEAQQGEVSGGGKYVRFAKAGRFSVTVVAVDSWKHTVQEEVMVDIMDHTPPVLTAETISVYKNKTPDYRAAVTATDNADGDLTAYVVVDDSQVLLDQTGTYSVTYSVEDFSGNKASFTSQVVVLPTPAKKIALDHEEVYLGGNEYLQLTANVSPKDWDGTVKWKSSDESVATVYDGLVYWQGAGECTITAKADGQKAKCKVVCESVEATTVTLTRHSIELDEGKSKRLGVTVLPSNWKGEVIWRSSNPSVAVVDDGVVTWVGNGTCYVTAYVYDTLYDSCTVRCTGGFSLGDLFNDLFGNDEEAHSDAQEQDTQETAHSADRTSQKDSSKQTKKNTEKKTKKKTAEKTTAKKGQ